MVAPYKLSNITDGLLYCTPVPQRKQTKKYKVALTRHRKGGAVHSPNCREYYFDFTNLYTIGCKITTTVIIMQKTRCASEKPTGRVLP